MESTIILQLRGLSCGQCAAAVQRALLGSRGVYNVDVSLETMQARVRYDSEAISPDELRQVVVAAGYGAQ